VKEREMALAAIVFDCDGVILESAGIKTEGFAHVGEAFGPERQKMLIDYHAERGGVSRLLKFDWFYREALGLVPSQADIAELDARFCAFCDAAIAAAPFVPGFLETFAAWRGKIPFYVASGSPQADMDKNLGPRGILDGFAGVYGSPPAKAELLRRIIRNNGYNPAEVLMVGDARTDLEAAQSNGTLFYGRGEGFAAAGHPCGPDLSGLPAHIESLI
jgi:phosphoglycolate phosphatase-like HAD superfamily hydrolase